MIGDGIKDAGEGMDLKRKREIPVFLSEGNSGQLQMLANFQLRRDRDGACPHTAFPQL